MILKSFFKRCALLVPPFRRLYRTANIHRFEREVIAAERDFIASERDTLRLELDQLAAQHYALRGEREIWLAEREALLAEREALQSERNGMSGQVRELRAGKEEDLARILAKLSLLEGKIPAPGLLPAAGRARKAAQVQSANLAAVRYLDLLEDCLVGRLLEDNPIPTPWSKEQYDAEVRFLGRDWPSKALTMIGTTRLRHLRILTEQVLREGVPGDFLEAGVWRGGACIYVRSIFAAYGVADRRVWVADSFQGLPPPDPDKYPVDAGDIHHTYEPVKVSLEEVKGNFEKFGFLDDQVVFLPGWFEDTLPQALVDRLAILRLDGDMYASTMVSLEALYDKVVPGGFVIIDDYCLKGARTATDDFRERRGITTPLEEIDGAAVFWRKP